MPILRPQIPKRRIPFYVDGVMDLQQRSVFWARLATLAMLLATVGIGGYAYLGVLPWWTLVFMLVAFYTPIATWNRIEELGRKVEEQVLDVLAEEQAGEVEGTAGADQQA